MPFHACFETLFYCVPFGVKDTVDSCIADDSIGHDGTAAQNTFTYCAHFFQRLLRAGIADVGVNA